MNGKDEQVNILICFERKRHISLFITVSQYLFPTYNNNFHEIGYNSSIIYIIFFAFLYS